MKAMIRDLKIKDDVLSFFLLEECTKRYTKSEKPYLGMTLKDKTGSMTARMWDIPGDLDEATLTTGAVVKVKGEVGEWQGKPQLNVKQIRTAHEEEYQVADLLRRSKRDPSEIYEDLKRLISSHVSSSQMRLLIMSILTEHRDEYIEAPAAKSVHHAYIGGLVEHVLSLSQSCVLLVDQYSLSIDHLLATAVLHDVGKIWELKRGMETGYTREGSLLGHIAIGLELVAKKADEISLHPRTKTEVLHMIASHHGLLEYGSPKIPLMKEAMAFHYLDTIDARLAICDKVLEEDQGDGEFTDFSNILGGPLYKELFKEKDS